VIGTHRLLQRDVAFHDLGLVVVDEEHRFGVGHKERLKQLRADVDTLTLTATPIPRTLNMALGGLRDLSLMTTPPAERVAIETFVAEWLCSNVEAPRPAEVYNAFKKPALAVFEGFGSLRRLVQATIRVGYGQMRERDLEQLMLDFYHRRCSRLQSSPVSTCRRRIRSDRPRRPLWARPVAPAARSRRPFHHRACRT
jgi:transcription-repair coupling factor (superfamily II helicase)